MSIIWKGEGGMDVAPEGLHGGDQKRSGSAGPGHHCFDMNLGHMAMAVEQRIRLTAMVAAAAPPSLTHAMRCLEIGRGVVTVAC